MNERITSDIAENLFNFNVDLARRVIYIGTVNFDCDGKDLGVEAMMTEFAIKGLNLLDDGKKRIRVLMDNTGGDWLHGMAIYDAIRSTKSPVDIEVYGQAMSMGAVILQAGERRLLHPNSAIMVHDGYVDGGERPVRSARSWSNYEERTRHKMYEIFASRSGHPPSYWKRKCDHDYIMSAEEAIMEGLADEVIKPSRELPRVKRGKR